MNYNKQGQKYVPNHDVYNTMASLSVSHNFPRINEDSNYFHGFALHYLLLLVNTRFLFRTSETLNSRNSPLVPLIL
jgi:hypothetical protein